MTANLETAGEGFSGSTDDWAARRWWGLAALALAQFMVFLD